MVQYRPNRESCQMRKPSHRSLLSSLETLLTTPLAFRGDGNRRKPSYQRLVSVPNDGCTCILAML